MRGGQTSYDDSDGDLSSVDPFEIVEGDGGTSMGRLGLKVGVREAFERIRETAETEKGEVEVSDASMRPTMTDIVGTPQELALRAAAFIVFKINL